jgi:hypothetical protein
LVVATGGPAGAAEFNKRPHLPPSAQAKINNTRARIFALEHELAARSKKIEKKSGKQGVVRVDGLCLDPRTGVVVDRTNPRSERIVALKDIVNLGGQLEIGAGCRR